MCRVFPLTSVLTPPGVSDPTCEKSSFPQDGPHFRHQSHGGITSDPLARRLACFQDSLLGFDSLLGSQNSEKHFTPYCWFSIKAVIQKQPNGRDAESKVWWGAGGKNGKFPCFQGAPPSQNLEARANQEALQTPQWFKRA